MKHRSAALAAELSESPQIPLFQDFCLDLSLSIEHIILGIRSSEVFTVLFAFSPPFFHWHTFHSNIEKGIHIFLEERRVFFQAQCLIILRVFTPRTILGKRELVCLLA